MSKTRYQYVIGIGSNQPHHRFGPPARIIGEALSALARTSGFRLIDASHNVISDPIGPSRRRYANAAAVIETKLEPDAVLSRLKGIERRFGRRRGGQKWRARVLDLDVLLWTGGCWEQNALIIPHLHFRERSFVLEPLCALVPRWRDPVTGLTPRHLLFRLRHPVPVDAPSPSR